MTYIITYIPDMQPSASPLTNVIVPPLTQGGDFVSEPMVAPGTQSASEREQRLRFLLFLKILIQHLRDTRNYYLLAKSKLLIKAVVRHNRMGDPQFSDLMESIERRLRPLVGEQHWRRAHLLMRHYIATGGTRTDAKLTPQAKQGEKKESRQESETKEEEQEEIVS